MAPVEISAAGKLFAGGVIEVNGRKKDRIHWRAGVLPAIVDDLCHSVGNYVVPIHEIKPFRFSQLDSLVARGPQALVLLVVVEDARVIKACHHITRSVGGSIIDYNYPCKWRILPNHALQGVTDIIGDVVCVEDNRNVDHAG